MEIADLMPNEEAVICELADAAAVLGLTKGVDAIVHFGGAPLETKWETILNSSIVGSYNIYEGGAEERRQSRGLRLFGPCHRLSQGRGPDRRERAASAG